MANKKKNKPDKDKAEKKDKQNNAAEKEPEKKGKSEAVEKTETPREESPMQLPVNFMLMGEIEPGDLRVYIRQDVYNEIEALAKSDTSKELGSFLIGNYSGDPGRMHVVISGCIEAKYTDASASTLTFTHETWDYVHKERANRFPDGKILGWQHTHPDYGIFLSSYDMFIQENFFNLPFQVAYVVDPLKCIRGFYQWKDGKVAKLNGYYIYDEIGKKIEIAEDEPVVEISADVLAAQPAGNVKKPKLALIIGASLLLVMAACIVFLMLGNNRLADALETAQAQQAALESQQAEIEQIVQYYQTLPEDNASISDLQAQLDEQQVVIVEQAGTIDELETRLEALEPETGEYLYFMNYTVERGDTLSSICKQYNIDYDANRDVLLGVNGIKDANRIAVGQVILLPTYMIVDNG